MNRKIRKRKVRQERKRETFLHFSLSSGFYTFFPLKNTGNRGSWFVAWPFDDGLQSQGRGGQNEKSVDRSIPASAP